MLVAMRYVAICQNGSHVQDVLWFKWAHRGHDEAVTEEVRFCRAYKELRFERSIEARRGTCLASRHVQRVQTVAVAIRAGREGIAGPRRHRCDGRQPWEDAAIGDGGVRTPSGRRAEGRDRQLHRNAYRRWNIPRSGLRCRRKRADLIRGNVYFAKAVADNGGPQAEMVAGWIAYELGVSAETVPWPCRGRGRRSRRFSELKDGEWAAFVKKCSREGPSGEDFVVDGWTVSGVDSRSEGADRPTCGVGRVRRVREVRALLGQASQRGAALVCVDLGPDRRRRPVYPAIELFGEGIFLRFDEDRLTEWESGPRHTGKRADILVNRRAGEAWAHRLNMRNRGSRALHTIAQFADPSTCIRQWLLVRFPTGKDLRQYTDRPDRTAGHSHIHRRR